MRNVFRPHSFQNLEAVHPRQPHIEHDQVEGRPLCFAQRGFAIVDHDGIMACFRQGGGNMASEADLVVYYQNAHELVTLRASFTGVDNSLRRRGGAWSRRGRKYRGGPLPRADKGNAVVT